MNFSDQFGKVSLILGVMIALESLFEFSPSLIACEDLVRVIGQSQRIIEMTKIDTETEIVQDGDSDLIKRGWPINGKI